uniref:F-box domain-containing protein n=1 Tax=Araucaria cunninghamii TaxID=56994 RepID=A0A0D6QZ52_ARACU
MAELDDILSSEGDEESGLSSCGNVAENEDDLLAQFLESEVLAEESDEEDMISRPSKRLCLEEDMKNSSEIEYREKCFDSACEGKQVPIEGGFVTKLRPDLQSKIEACGNNLAPKTQPTIENGNFSKIPIELFQKILKFLSSEDLVTCALVCSFLNHAASDEALWRRLYCMRWGLPSPEKLKGKPRARAWKRLYIERDKEDMIEFVRNTPPEFREYYIQMQAAKRSQAPLPSQVNDDMIILDKTVAEQISHLKHSRGLPDEFTAEHVCTGRTCTYSQIGDSFLCDKTGRVHVCDDTCREIILDPSSQLLVCTISGRCFDRWLSPSEEEQDPGEQQGDANVAADEAEPFMGSGRFARAYLLGYNCDDEKELEAALAIC